MTTESSADEGWRRPARGDVSVMSDKPLCECKRARLSPWNKGKSCNLCQLEERDAYFKTVQSIDNTMPRYRIVRVLKEATRPLRSGQIAKMAVVGDNETYRILRDLVNRGHAKSRQDGLATFYTYAKDGYRLEPVNRR